MEKNQELQEIIDLLKKNDLLEISYKFGQVEYTIRAKDGGTYSASQQSHSSQISQLTASASSTAAATGKEVKAPIVGTFYVAPAPDKPPFTAVGKTVKKGDVLFIIESMKLMNEVTSEYDGTVKEILISDGDAVEYDQVLMVIE